MTDSVLKAIAENKIKELEIKVSVLRGELKSIESFHSAAWAEYGSELCSGEMIANESKIRMEINLTLRDIIFLRGFIEGRIDISREEQLRNNSAEVAAQIVTLQDSKKLIDEKLSEIAMVKNLLAITS